MQMFAKAIEKSRARIKLQPVVFPINFQLNIHCIFRSDLCRFFRCGCRRNADELRSQGHGRARYTEFLEKLAAGLRAAKGLSRFITTSMVTTGCALRFAVHLLIFLSPRMIGETKKCPFT